MPLLNTRRLDQVIEVDSAGGWVAVQSRCRLDALRLFLAGRGLALAAGPEMENPANVGALGAGFVEAGDQRAGGLGATRETASAVGEPLRERAAGVGAGPFGTAGAAVIAGEARAIWADLLTRSGQITRHAPGEFPPDAFAVAVALATAPG
jgi:hypothetical protein